MDLIPDKCDDGGLGISLEGTVDILNGAQLCPHHYIDSLRPGGPAAFSNALRSGDELLQVSYSRPKDNPSFGKKKAFRFIFIFTSSQVHASLLKYNFLKFIHEVNY